MRSPAMGFARAAEALGGSYIYAAVAVLLALLILVIHAFWSGAIGTEEAKVYLQALTGIATLALLYFAYFTASSKKEEDVAHLELAVRPVLLWEIESDGKAAKFSYVASQHPIYDFVALLRLDGGEMRIDSRHLWVFGQNVPGSPEARREGDITGFISRFLPAGPKPSLLEISISYHSEVGGRYSFTFTKEVSRAKSGFGFRHRKIVSAKYPWRKEIVSFDG